MELNLPFNKTAFEEFVSGFLPEDFVLNEKELKISGKDKIKSGCVLGECNSLDLKVVILNHEKERDPRISLTKEAFKIMSENWAKKALVVFAGANSGNWRMSLMTISFDINEKNKVVSNLSNPRRKSFFLGQDAKTATPNKFLIKKGRVKNIQDLESRFDVEVVTKEFFNNYKNLYIKLVEYLKKDKAFSAFAGNRGIKIDDFSKKLLGQIVFIYFLQKKKWLGAKKGEKISDGDDQFLRNLFEKCKREEKSFFNDYLEHLFYGCLNKVPERAGSFYREKFGCQIPFLNGGLFEPISDYNWETEFIHIPNEIFSNESGSGILDIFDLYNFTIDENTPEDQEVSVDPEMLGKVFENLLEDNIRKGQGAFYTPREIVYYMCRESLIKYLASEHSNLSEEKIRQYIEAANSLHKNDIEEFRRNWRGESFTPGQWKELDDILANIKVCDPACGSGAFLVGMLNEIVKLRIFLQLTPDSELFSQSPNAIKELSEYYLKKETIQNCLYGVDIDPGAVDIAKLRFWLSIVVEEDIDDIEPLPNLDYKIMQGNSLLEDLVIGGSVIKFKFDGSRKMDGRTKEQKALFETGKTMRKLFLEESDTLAEMLEKYHTEYFSITDPDKKKILKKKIDEIEDDLINSKCLEEIRNAQSAIKNNPNNEKERLKNLEKELAIKKVLNKWKTDHLRPFFPWKLHFGEVFGRENGGFDVVIANPPYINIFNIKEKHIRDYLSSYYSVARNKTDLYAFFVEKGNNILRLKGILTFIFSNSWLGTDSFLNFRKYLIENTKIQQLVKCPPGIFDEATVTVVIAILTKEIVKKHNSIKLIELKENNFRELGFDLSYDFIKNQASFGFSFNKQMKINIPTEKLENLVKFSLGIKTSDDKKFILEDKKDNDCYKVLRGKDVGKWRYSFSGKWVWYRPDLMNERKGAGPRKLENFLTPKILVKDISNEIQAAFDYENYLTLDTISIIFDSEKYDLRFILGLLNSKFINKWFKLNFDAGLHIKINQLKNIPIPQEVDNGIEKMMVNFVDNILNITKSEDYLNNPEKQEKTRELERGIDELVYKLYGLTEEEVGIVEGKI